MRAFGILPAAGISRRMGRPKLLLPWGDHTLIEQTLAAWNASGVAAVIVTLHPEAVELARLCQAARAHVVQPTSPPADMKASVRLALDHVQQQLAPTAADAWLLAPADMPLLSPSTIDRLIAAHESQLNAGILAPSYQGLRGHPVLFPWSLAREVHSLAENEAVNALVRRHGVRELDVNDPGISVDVDTPADYLRLRGNSGAGAE